MTDEQKARIRELKARTVSELGRSLSGHLSRWGEMLAATDGRIVSYIEQVCADTDGHNVWELLGITRFFKLMERYRWNGNRVRRFFKFYELLRFNGATGRQRYKLTPVQCFQFANIFAFDDADGRRLCRTAYIFVPRKFSKTTSAASLAVWDMLFGDANAQAYVGANSYQQAKICFDEIRAIMRDLDPGERHFRVNREQITFKGGGRDSTIRCLTANAKTQDGLNASLVIMDEYAQARNTAGKNGADLKNVLTSSMGARREPLTVIITTASEVIDGPFVHELEGVQRVLAGELENDSVFGSLFMPDVDDAEDDPRTWRKVQPHLGVTVQSDFYQREWENARMSAENLLAFRTKLLNVFTVNDERIWLPAERVQMLVGDIDIDRLPADWHGRDCAVAFDLSVRDDFSAVSYTMYNSEDKRFYSHTDYYFPEGAMAGHPNEQLYRRWVEAGWLRLCPGERIDVKMIAEDILRRAKVVKIMRIGYDSYKSQELVNILASVGGRDVLTPFSQTYGNFNLPVESLEMMAWSSPPRLVINRNPINLFCFGNCVIDTDRLENKKPIKASHWRKIDGVITLLMTLGLLYSIER